MLEMWLNDVINVNTGIFVNVGVVQHWGCSSSPSMTRGQGSRTRKKEFTVWFALVFVFFTFTNKKFMPGRKTMLQIYFQVKLGKRIDFNKFCTNGFEWWYSDALPSRYGNRNI